MNKCVSVKLHGPARMDGPVIVTTVVPVGSQSTHMICPHCYSEISTMTKPEPGIIAYISGIVIALLGSVLQPTLILSNSKKFYK